MECGHDIPKCKDSIIWVIRVRSIYPPLCTEYFILLFTNEQLLVHQDNLPNMRYLIFLIGQAQVISFVNGVAHH